MKPAISERAALETKNDPGLKSLKIFAQNILPVFLYLLILIIFTWPLVLHLDSFTPGTFVPDREQNLWYLWWVKQALTEYHVNPYFTNFLYYPSGITLYLFTTYLTGAVLVLPFELLWGTVVGFNLLYFFGVVGGAWGAYCLAFYLLGNRKGAFLAGLIFAFSPWLNFTGDQNQLNYLQIPWLPFFLLYLLKFLRMVCPNYDISGLTPRYQNRLNPSRKYQIRYGTLTALFLILNAFSGHYILLYAAFLGGGITAGYLLTIAVKRDWKALRQLLLKLGLVLLPALVAYIPLLIGILKEIRSGAFQATASDYQAGLDILGLVLPSTFHGEIRGLIWQVVGYAPSRYMLSIGLVALVLLTMALIKVRASRLWAGLFLVALVLALGTNLTFNGTISDIPLPAALLTRLPVVGALRDASRWIIPASLALAIAAGYGLGWLLERKSLTSNRTNLIYALVLVLFLLENQPQPDPWTEWQIPPVSAIFKDGQLTRPGALLELPLDERNLDKADNMYYQIYHARPILGGYLTRPAAYSYANSPFSFFYEDYQLSDKDVLKPDPDELGSFLSYYHFGYLVMHKNVLTKQRQTTFSRLIEQVVGPVKTGCNYEDEQVLVCPVPPPARLIPFLALNTGWYKAEADNGGQRWLYGQAGFLGGFVPADGTYNLSFEAAAYLKPRTLQVEVDGKVLATQTISPERQTYRLSLSLGAGNHLIQLYSPEAPDRPSNNGVPSDDRTLTLLFSRLKLENS